MSARAEALRVAETVRLGPCFTGKQARPSLLLGRGTGNSVEFQDQRGYQPGDDPRWLNWSAYARTGALVMKLYREEAAPRIDFLLDRSASMSAFAAKRERTLALTHLCLELARGGGADLRTYRSDGSEWSPFDDRLPVDATLFRSAPASDDSNPLAIPLPWRGGAVRLIISDLLSRSDPETVVRQLSSPYGRLVILAPWSSEESAPAWDGHVEMIDCESGDKRMQFVSEELRERYRGAYARHFDSWSRACLRHGAILARVPSDGSLASALTTEAVPRGVFELCSSY